MGYVTVHMVGVGGVLEYVRGKVDGERYKFVWDGDKVIYVVCCRNSFCGYAIHRLDGPSVIVPPSYVRFNINDIEYMYTRHYCKDAGMSDEETFMWVLRFGDELPTTIEGFYGEDWCSIGFDQL